MRALAEQGWLAIALAEADGGVGLSWVEAAVLLEQIGRHTAPVPFLPSLLALMALAGAEEPQREWVGDVASGARLGCVAWNNRADTLVAVASGPTWTVSGRIGPVEGAAVADVAVVVVGDDVFAVGVGRGGSPTGRACHGWHAGAVVAASSTGLAATCLGDAGLADRESSTGGCRCLRPRCSGGSDRVLEMAVQYAKDRVQFDQPIGSFQAIKHRCADMVVDVEGMRSATWYAAWAISAGDPDASAAASTAKVWSSDAANRVMASGLQVHGGIGFTWEHDLAPLHEAVPVRSAQLR